MTRIHHVAVLFSASLLIACGGQSKSSANDADAPQEYVVDKSKGAEPSAKLKTVSKASSEAKVKPAAQPKQKCGFQAVSNAQYDSYSRRGMPEYYSVRRDAVDSDIDLDNPCMLRPSDLKLLGSNDNLALMLLSNEPDILNDPKVQHAFVCLNDFAAANFAEDNEFQWPKLVEKMVAHGKTFLPNYKTVEMDIPLDVVVKLSKYDSAKGGFYVHRGGRNLDIGKIFLPSANIAGCLNKAPYTFEGDIDNWFEGKFTIELDQPVGELFIPMTPEKAEDFVTRQLKDSNNRFVKVNVKVTAKEYSRTPKSTGFNSVTFKGQVDGIEVRHKDIEAPLLVKSFNK